MNSKLPKEAFAFFKSMGIDINSLEPEAQDMWTKLNDMHSKSTVEYESFLQGILTEENKQKFFDNPSENKDSSVKENEILIRPEAGISIECRTVGNDGIKIRDLNANVKRVLFINICTHKGLQCPKDEENNLIEGTVIQNTNGIEIPMVIGKIRDENFVEILDSYINQSGNTSTKLAIDVIVNPIILSTCRVNSRFQDDLLKLLMDCIEAERNIIFDKSISKISQNNYEFGRGENKSKPVLFPISVDQVTNRETAQTPASLLEKVISAKSSPFQDDKKVNELEMLLPSSNQGKVNALRSSSSLVKIQELKENSYPSEEIRISQESSNCSLQDTTIREEIVSSSSDIGRQKTSIVASSMKKGFLNNKDVTNNKQSQQKSNPELSNREQKEVDQLFRNADEEWETQSSKYEADSEDLFQVSLE